MKKRYIVFFVLFFLFSNLLTAQTNHYKVKLWIHQFEDSTIYVYSSYGEKKEFLLDSLQITDEGSFILEGDYRMGMVLVASKYQKLFSFILDKNTNFTIDIYPYGFYEVKGCEENQKYLEYQKINKEHREFVSQCETGIKKNPASRDSLSLLIKESKAQFAKFQEDFFKQYPNNLMTVLYRSIKNPSLNPKFFRNGRLIKEKGLEYAYDIRSRYWENFVFSDQRLLSTPYFYQKFKKYTEEITMQSADSVYVAIKDFIDTANSRGGELYSKFVIDLYLEKLPFMPFSFNESIYVQLVENFLNQGKTPWISPSEIDKHNENIEAIKPYLPSNKFPNINNLDTLDSKYIVVLFHSATCESCKKNFNDLMDFYTKDSKRYDAKIVSIEVGDKSDEGNYPWTNWQISPQELKQRYGIDIIRTPEIYILDREKKILNKTVIYSHIKTAIEGWEAL